MRLGDLRNNENRIMKDWFLEFLTVLSFSRKTQYAIILGMIGYLAMSMIGSYMLRDFQLTGFFAPFSAVVKDKLIGKYDNAALGCLVSSWLLAIKLYRKDKKRLYLY